MNTPSILVIDDEPNNFDVIEALLPPDLYTLHYAASGPAALDALDLFRPDVILLDVMMPDMDGMEVCRRVKALPAWVAVPIIMVTALNDKQDLARGLAAGASDFLSKPVSGIELRARVQAMVRIKQQYDEIQALAARQSQTVQLLEQSLGELRGSLAHRLSHELNTPLNGIMGGLGLLATHLEDLGPDEVQELVDLSLASAQRLERLTQKLLTYLKLELTATPEVDPVGTAVGSRLENLASVIAHRHQRSLDLMLAVSPGWVVLPGSTLNCLIEEVVDNGFKFSEKGTPVIVQGEQRGSEYFLAVRDRGRGMTEEQIASIGAFVQFERSTYEQQGTGLGLKIAKRIVELYGGRCQIESLYEQSTTLSIYLPACDPLA